MLQKEPDGSKGDMLVVVFCAVVAGVSLAAFLSLSAITRSTPPPSQSIGAPPPTLTAATLLTWCRSHGTSTGKHWLPPVAYQGTDFGLQCVPVSTK